MAWKICRRKKNTWERERGKEKNMKWMQNTWNYSELVFHTISPDEIQSTFFRGTIVAQLSQPHIERNLILTEISTDTGVQFRLCQRLHPVSPSALLSRAVHFFLYIFFLYNFFKRYIIDIQFHHEHFYLEFFSLDFLKVFFFLIFER